MDLFSALFIVGGLILFEVIISVDNAILNAEVLGTMSKKGSKWFLLWGILIAVFLVRGVLPWLIVWLSTPGIGPIEAFTASFSGGPHIAEVIEASSPILLTGGGTFWYSCFPGFSLRKSIMGCREKDLFTNRVWFLQLFL